MNTWSISVPSPRMSWADFPMVFGRNAMLVTILALMALLYAEVAVAEVPYHHDINNRKCCLVIAHAGGGVEGNPYTNSEEAVLSNLKAGARVFELDFAKTSDGKWVGTHDWGLWTNQTQYKGNVPPTYGEFSQHKLVVQGQRIINRSYKAVTMPFLESVMTRNKKIILITDTKYNLAELANTLKGSEIFNRIYPQAYSLEEVEMLAGLGYKRIILTIYKMDISNPDRLTRRIAPIAKNLHALTVPMDYFAENHEALIKLGVPIYTHGPPANINSRELHARFKRFGISGFYVD
ncbi:MAG: hypothetical protein HY799_05975 [Nitrosomonadales bacterium]|nr:hypothetical protein [Nitrosomonadales bacterium]